MNFLSARVHADLLSLSRKSFNSRLILGTGKYRSFDEMQQCHRQAEVELVTVAIRRVPLNVTEISSITDYIDPTITLIPNTSGAYQAKEALRLCRLAAGMGLHYLKLEVMADVKTLLPDPVETVKAVEEIRQEFSSSEIFLMVYTSDDPVLARKLRDKGADCIMPAGSPIGSGRGIQNPYNLELLMKGLDKECPVILDAGIGAASDACLALEMGVDAVKAGRQCFLSGRIEKKLYASASSPSRDF